MNEYFPSESDKLKIEIQKNQELRRIENFLRGEVKILREENEQLRNSPEFFMANLIKHNFFFRLIKKIIRVIFNTKRNKLSNNDTLEKKVNEIGTLANRSFLKFSNVSNFDFLFIQLSNNSEIGGVHQLNSVFEYLKQKELSVESIYLNKDFSRSDLGFNNEINLEKSNFNYIIFSGLEAFKFIQNHPNLRSTKKINFFQGPDYLFPGNEVEYNVFRSSLLESEMIISQSLYLDQLAKFIGATATKVVTIGPKASTFWDQGKKKQKLLLMPTRVEPDKGLRFALPALSKIREQGWRVIGYGDLVAPEMVIHFDEHFGRISRREVADLLQEAALLLDLSIYEGLGLSALEAGMCGTRTILSSNSGVLSLQDFNQELILLKNSLNPVEIVSTVINYELAAHEASRNNLVINANKYSWENNIDKFVNELLKI